MAVYTDFSSLLAGATILCGVIWAGDRLYFKARRDKMAPEPKLVEYAVSFFPILLAVSLLRSFVVEPFRIPSGSMRPTLLEGDFILVNKFSYGIRLPLTGTKVWAVDEPKTGEIFVFRSPKDTSIDFIKRVVGLPGDKISYHNKVLMINGKPIENTFLGTVYETTALGQQYPVKHYQEKLADRPHSIYISQEPREDSPEVTVPEGMYFAMGDNRDFSGDSRDWGFVPQGLILGKAFYIWMSWDSQAKDIRWSRVGHVLRE